MEVREKKEGILSVPRSQVLSLRFVSENPLEFSERHRESLRDDTFTFGDDDVSLIATYRSSSVALSLDRDGSSSSWMRSRHRALSDVALSPRMEQDPDGRPAESARVTVTPS